MNLFRSNTEALRRSFPAKTSKRFACWATDLIIVALVAELIFTGLFQIVQGTAAYRAAENDLNAEIAYYESFTEETHVVEYVDGQRVTTDVTVLKNVYRAICLSYEIFGNDQRPDFTIESGHDVTINGVHSRENDNVAYFYTRYLKEHPEIAPGAEKDLFKVYKKAFGNDAEFMFTFNEELSDMPVLNTQVAYYLFYYLFIDSADTVGQTGATYYEAYYNAYSSMLEEAEMLVLQSEPYYSTHYRNYMQAFSAQARYTNITLVVSILASCLIILLVPKFLFKNERTISYRLFGLGVINSHGKANEWYVIVIKTFLESFGLIPIAFILYMFPPFSGGYEAMFVPVSVDSGVSFGLIILVISLIGIAVSAVGLFTNNRQNLLNLIFNDFVVDIHLQDDGEVGEVNQGRPY